MADSGPGPGPAGSTPDPMADADLELIEHLLGLTDEELSEVVAGLPADAVDLLLGSLPVDPATLPAGPAEQAAELEERFRIRDHTRLISDRIAAAVRDVAEGRSRWLIIETPPRIGKSTLVSLFGPLWILRMFPEWKVALTSYDAALVADWSRQVRNLATEHPSLGIRLTPDSGAVGQWRTTSGGGIIARSTGQGLTGLGAKVLIVDDPVKDFAEAHSEHARDKLWSWWLSVAQTRLEPPSLVLVTMTRWHEDDMVGRLLSAEHEGDPATWEEIRLPALANPSPGTPDPLGRDEGEPLISPLLDETAEQARQRWLDVRTAVGPYTFAGMYQQEPAPSKGELFDLGWLRYWTVNPALADRDDAGELLPVTDHAARVVWVDPAQFDEHTGVASGRWIDSWDMAFKGKKDSDYVVGQRWVGSVGYHYLMHGARGKWTFTQTLDRVKAWCAPHGTPYARYVHERIVEDKANGTAVIDSLQAGVPGMVAVNPTDSKVGRALSVTPVVESGHVLLPHPADPGNEWVMDLVEELRAFPNGRHDDQVDALTQYLNRVRNVGSMGIGNPARSSKRIPQQRTGSGGMVPGAASGGTPFSRYGRSIRRR